jgi:hypothetical protein
VHGFPINHHPEEGSGECGDGPINTQGDAPTHPQENAEQHLANANEHNPINAQQHAPENAQQHATESTPSQAQGNHPQHTTDSSQAQPTIPPQPHHIQSLPPQASDPQPEPEGQNRNKGKKKIKKNTRASLKIASLNMRGHGPSGKDPENKWNHINQLVKEKRIGVLAIQEAYKYTFPKAPMQMHKGLQ